MKTLQQLRDYCNSKRGVTEDFPFDFETLVFKVGPKMFVLTNVKADVLWVNLKSDPAQAIALREQYEAIVPGYHMNKKHWNTVMIDGSLPDYLITELIDQSYDLVFKGLTKRQKEEVLIS